MGAVVLGLDDLVPWPELPAELLHHRLLRPCRIQLDLELHVQLADAQGATLHRAQHLDVADGGQPEPGQDARPGHLDQRVPSVGPGVALEVGSLSGPMVMAVTALVF